ncbi:MAG: hypothetical protein US50_C0017G0002 [Candidatus Nomurabacteria bacterium GW2011_GWB1_37_5]|uniref:Uncharacterized protein n=1 Tax=Candidatus Nomurabacteria bacterium GW2011_GWB1_37_5 TaxID=1618742 RepID=A0A0G0K3X8_9BACT|nr:MAG: hypothetical protein US50_C0017G0002 [Candidatus Nomurabacteria bacterium GW2011_GWB1_37_5]
MENNKTNVLVSTFGDQKRWVNHKNKIPIMPSGKSASRLPKNRPAA